MKFTRRTISESRSISAWTPRVLMIWRCMMTFRLVGVFVAADALPHLSGRLVLCLHDVGSLFQHNRGDAFKGGVVAVGLVEFGFHIVFELSEALDCRVTFGEELPGLIRPGVAGQRSVVEFDE